MATLDLLLRPEEVLASIVLQTTASAAGAHQRRLELVDNTILLSEVEALELRVADRRRDLLELELVNLGVDGGQEPKKERGEDHGGWEETTRRRRKGCIARLESRRSRITSCASL